jgi:hypothetical protein
MAISSPFSPALQGYGSKKNPILFSFVLWAHESFVLPNSHIDNLSSPQLSMEFTGLPPSFLCSLGFKLEEFGSSGAAGSWFSNHLPTGPPQREACEEIAPEARLGETVFFCESRRDGPDPMKE